MKRCFVALGLPDATRTALAELTATLRSVGRQAAERVRPIASRNFHVTIKFLGATPDEQVPALVEVLRETAAAATLREVHAEGVGAFPTNIRPRILLAQVGAGAAGLTQLADHVETAVEPLGFAREKRPREPHVTLARVEGASPNGPLTDWIQAAHGKTFGPIDTAQLILFESQLNPGGSIYTPLATVPLGVP